MLVFILPKVLTSVAIELPLSIPLLTPNPSPISKSRLTISLQLLGFPHRCIEWIFTVSITHNGPLDRHKDFKIVYLNITQTKSHATHLPEKDEIVFKSREITQNTACKRPLWAVASTTT